MKVNSSRLIKYALLLYLTFTAVLPIIILFVKIRPEHIRDVFTSAQFGSMLGNSLVTTLIATAISVSASASSAGT